MHYPHAAMHFFDPDSISHAAELISQSDALIVAAGAGMDVDSELPDFRGKEGFWQAYPALGREEVDFYRIACHCVLHAYQTANVADTCV